MADPDKDYLTTQTPGLSERTEDAFSLVGSPTYLRTLREEALRLYKNQPDKMREFDNWLDPILADMEKNLPPLSPARIRRTRDLASIRYKDSPAEIRRIDRQVNFLAGEKGPIEEMTRQLSQEKRTAEKSDREPFFRYGLSRGARISKDLQKLQGAAATGLEKTADAFDWLGSKGREAATLNPHFLSLEQGVVSPEEVGQHFARGGRPDPKNPLAQNQPHPLTSAIKEEVAGLAETGGSLAAALFGAMGAGATYPFEVYRQMKGGENLPSALLEAGKTNAQGFKEMMMSDWGRDFLLSAWLDPLTYTPTGTIKGLPFVKKTAKTVGEAAKLTTKEALAFADELGEVYSKHGDSASMMSAARGVAQKHKVPFHLLEKHMGEGLKYAGQEGLAFGVPHPLIPGAYLGTKELASRAQLSRTPLLGPAAVKAAQYARGALKGLGYIPPELGGEHAYREIQSQLRRLRHDERQRYMENVAQTISELQQIGEDLPIETKRAILRDHIKAPWREETSIQSPPAPPPPPQAPAPKFELTQPTINLSEEPTGVRSALTPEDLAALMSEPEVGTELPFPWLYSGENIPPEVPEWRPSGQPPIESPRFRGEPPMIESPAAARFSAGGIPRPITEVVKTDKPGMGGKTEIVPRPVPPRPAVPPPSSLPVQEPIPPLREQTVITEGPPTDPGGAMRFNRGGIPRIDPGVFLTPEEMAELNKILERTPIRRRAARRAAIIEELKGYSEEPTEVNRMMPTEAVMDRPGFVKEPTEIMTMQPGQLGPKPLPKSPPMAERTQVIPPPEPVLPPEPIPVTTYSPAKEEFLPYEDMTPAEQKYANAVKGSFETGTNQMLAEGVPDILEKQEGKYKPQGPSVLPRRNRLTQGLMPRELETKRQMSRFVVPEKVEKEIDDPDKLVVAFQKTKERQISKARHQRWIADAFGGKGVEDAVMVKNSLGQEVPVDRQVFEKAMRMHDDAFESFKTTLLDKSLNVWKKVKLFGSMPSYMLTNMSGDLFLMWNAGLKNMFRFQEAQRLWDQGSNSRLVSKHSSLTYDDARELLKKNGIGTGFGMFDVMDDAPGAESLRSALSGKKGLKERAMSGYLDAATMGLHRGGAKWANWWDRTAKTALWLEFVGKGMSPEEALRQVFDVLPDYSDLDKVGRKFRQFQPFGTWGYKMLGIAPRLALRNPIGARMVSQFGAASPSITYEDEDKQMTVRPDVAPQYLREMGPTVPAQGPAGTQYAFTPREGLMESAAQKTPAGLLQGLRPELKAMIELGADLDLFTGEKRQPPEWSKPLEPGALAYGIESLTGMEPGRLQADPGTFESPPQTPWAQKWILENLLGDNWMMLLDALGAMSGTAYDAPGGDSAAEKVVKKLANRLTGMRPTITRPTDVMMDTLRSDKAKAVLGREGELQRLLKEAAREAEQNKALDIKK